MSSLQRSISEDQEAQQEAQTAYRIYQQTIIENPYIPALGSHFPSNPQIDFMSRAAVREILYGGAAGGGKSAGLLASALQYVTEPGYDAIIFRRSYADLEKPGALIPMSMLWLAGTDADYDGGSHRWYFPSGATLSFGHIQNEQSLIQDYQGSAFAFMGFDELTQFTEFMYRYMFSRQRKLKGLPFPIRTRATSNPGGIGHEWVKRRFIDIGDSLPNRKFIPAKLEDNPGLDREEYELSLAELDPVTRRQLRHGDWNVRPEGTMFKRAWFEGKFVDHAPHLRRMVRYWDLAATKLKPGKDPDFCAGCYAGFGEDGLYYICDMEHFRESESEVENRVKQTAGEDGTNVSIRIEQEPGAGSKLYINSLARMLKAFDVRPSKTSSDKVTRAKPFSAACERGDVRIVRGPWVADFLDELCAFPSVPHDDQVDSAAGGFNELAKEFEPWEETDVSKVLKYEFES